MQHKVEKMSNDAQSTSKPICFVIMPISDTHGYDNGHFGRVYEHVLKPAIIQAGFNAVRADDANKTDYIVLGIIQRIVESEMVLCDFSARNPNVMYELGIRHAFNKPVVLVKDNITDKVFDISGLRHTEYDKSLRIDSVQKDIDQICNFIKKTAEADSGDVNSVIQLAGIKSAEAPIGREVTTDTKIILSAISSLEQRLDSIESQKRQKRYFRIDGTNIILENNRSVTLGDELYDVNKNSLGEIIDIHPAEDKVFIKNKDGKVTPFASYSVKSMGLTDIPF